MKRRHYLILFILMFAFAVWGTVSSLGTAISKKKAEQVQTTTDLETGGMSTPVTTVVIPAPGTDDVVLDTLVEGQLIKSPLTIAGKARGTWFFEGSFPVSIVTLDGVTVATGIAQAQGEWMTTDYVPFKATLNYTKPANAASAAYLVLRKDNPSGEERFDKSLSIKVQW